MFKLALRNVFRHRLRTAMTLAAIVFGVVGLILTGGFVNDIYHQLGETIIHSQSGHLQIARKGFYEYGTRRPDKFVVDIPKDLREALLARAEVADVMERINFSGLISNGRSDWPIVGEGIEPEKEARLGTHVTLTAGRQLSKTDAYGILLGEGVAQALDLKPGDRATLLVNTAEGALNTIDAEVVGVFQSFSKDYDSHAVRIPLDAAHDLLRAKGANSVVISLNRTEDTERVAASISGKLQAEGLEVKTWDELNDFYKGTVALYKRQFGVLQVIILILVLLSVANSVNMSIFERVGEFGTMMALGNHNTMVFRLVMAEASVLGAIGGGLGVLIGISLALVISATGIPMPPPPNSNIGYVAFIRPTPSIAGMACLVGMVATILAALLPARRVSRMSISSALRQNV